MDNKDFTKISTALRSGTLDTPEVLESLESFGEEPNIAVVLDAMYHKIANTDHSPENNRLPITAFELKNVFRNLIDQTNSYLKDKIDADAIQREDHQLYTTLNYNLGNLVVRPIDVQPLIYDADLKGVLVQDDIATSYGVESVKVLNEFKTKTEYLDLEDIAKTLSEKLKDFDASASDKDISDIIELSQKQRAFKEAKLDGENIVNYSDYEDVINSNEKIITEFAERGELHKIRSLDDEEEDTSFSKLSEELEKASYEQGFAKILEQIKNGNKIYDRRIAEALLRDEIEDAFSQAQEPTLIIQEGPDAPKITSKNVKNNQPQDGLIDYIDWEEKYQEYLKAINLRELSTIDKTKQKLNFLDPNGGPLKTMKLLGQSVVSLNELGNADKTYLNVSPLTGTMRLGRDVMPQSEDGTKAFRLAALNARRKGWNTVYLNHTGKDAEAIPFIKEAIRAMVIEGQYDLDQIKVPKRFQKLIENYKRDNPEFTISDGLKENKEEFISASELNKESIDVPVAPLQTAPSTSTPDEPNDASESVPDNVTPPSNDADNTAPANAEPKNGSNVNNSSNVDSDIDSSVTNVKGQEVPNLDMPEDYSDYDTSNIDFGNDNDSLYNNTDVPVVSSVDKAVEFYQFSPTLSDLTGGFTHKPIFDMVADLIKGNEQGYWKTTFSLKSDDSSLANAVQSLTKDFLEQGLISPKGGSDLSSLIKNEKLGKIEKTFAKHLDRELTAQEKSVIKEHAPKIAEYLENFSNKGEHEIVVFTPNGMESFKNNSDKFEEVVANADFKRSADRKFQSEIAKYSTLKLKGEELFAIYDNIDLDHMTKAGCKVPENSAYKEQKVFDSPADEATEQTQRRNPRSPKP